MTLKRSKHGMVLHGSTLQLPLAPGRCGQGRHCSFPMVTTLHTSLKAPTSSACAQVRFATAPIIFIPQCQESVFLHYPESTLACDAWHRTSAAALIIADCAWCV